MDLNCKGLFYGLADLKFTMPIAFKMVFSNFIYVIISTTVFIAFWIIFNVFDQLLFFSPIVAFYLPDDAVNGFIISNITSILMGILVAMNVYIVRNSKLKLDKSLFSGSILGITSSACASCSSIGLVLISTFGGFGIIVTDFLTNYQFWIRILSIFFLLWALYSVHKRVTISCLINPNKNSKNKE